MMITSDGEWEIGGGLCGIKKKLHGTWWMA